MFDGVLASIAKGRVGTYVNVPSLTTYWNRTKLDVVDGSTETIIAYEGVVWDMKSLDFTMEID